MGSNPTRSAIALGEAQVRRWWFRLGLALIGVFGSYVGVTVILFVVGTHRTSLSQLPQEWLPMPPLETNRRLLIIAPHPDDEVLGCGGLIAEAVQRKVPVRVVWLTAGDGFPGAAMLIGRSTPDSQDYRTLGKTRIEEARHACQILGLSEADLFFLGYPDRGLWTMALAGDRVVRSPYTGYTRVAYPQCANSQHPYTAPSVVWDLIQILDEFQPTDIFTAHPLDDHPDHMACALFTMESIRHTVQRGALSQRPRLYYYLVHRGDWPLPQGDHPDRLLLPPFSMGHGGWFYLPLTPTAIERKRAALEAHATQYALMTRFLSSFVRLNELFQGAQVPTLSYRNPVDDNPALRLRPEGDIRAVQVTPQPNGLAVEITTRQPLKTPFQLQISLITIDARGRWNTMQWTYRPGSTVLPASRDGNTLLLWLAVPTMRRQQAGYLVVQTRLYGVEIDRTGVLPIPLSDAGWDSPVHATTPRSAPSHSR